METDWGGQGGGAYSDFEGFKYGETSLSAIRMRFGHNGLMFDARPPVSLAGDGALIFFNYYEISGKRQVATFVTTVTASVLAELQASHGNEKLGDFIAPYAKLSAVILAEQDYADTIWGAKKPYDSGYGPINWGGEPSGISGQNRLSNVSPDDYSVEDIFTGKTKLPDFKARDAKFNSFRTRIRNALNGGLNFAGEYSVVQIGCGKGCTFVVVASNRTGQPFNFPRGGEDSMYLSLKYQLSSRLFTTQWASYDESNATSNSSSSTKGIGKRSPNATSAHGRRDTRRLTKISIDLRATLAREAKNDVKKFT
ncbi:hypothetical protein [Pararhizobium sp. DWP1-1-3]|uniref:hypothetical protein n=1 Tax=Pararhizobium sp. DWP1-1-3 TaxID=2804652 RepID=UPI003CF0A6B3